MNEFKVNIDRIIALGLGLEHYFILYCLYTKEEQLIHSYTSKCKKINTEVFRELEKSGYL